MVEISPGGRLVHRQGEVAAALCRAVGAQTLAGLEVLPASFLAARRLRRIEDVEGDCGHTPDSLRPSAAEGKHVKGEEGEKAYGHGYALRCKVSSPRFRVLARLLLTSPRTQIARRPDMGPACAASRGYRPPSSLSHGRERSA